MLLAIVSEVAGTFVMKYSAPWRPVLGLGIMYVMLVISYGALAIAVKRIPLAVAYGAWESLGLIFITFCSGLLFSEPLNALKMGGITAIIIGLLLLKIGTYQTCFENNKR
jgi:spermidine export protein MdtJ